VGEGVRRDLAEALDALDLDRLNGIDALQWLGTWRARLRAEGETGRGETA
jgi:hypothetical protein